jgi:hypothetical protein
MRSWGVTLRVLKYSPDFASVTFPNGLKLARISNFLSESITAGWIASRSTASHGAVAERAGNLVLARRLTKYLHYPISKVS